MHLTLQSADQQINNVKATDCVTSEMVELNTIIEDYKAKNEDQKISIDELMESLESLTLEHQEQRNQDADRVG